MPSPLKSMESETLPSFTNQRELPLPLGAIHMTSVTPSPFQSPNQGKPSRRPKLGSSGFVTCVKPKLPLLFLATNQRLVPELQSYHNRSVRPSPFQSPT